jgi:hypothetical protein
VCLFPTQEDIYEGLKTVFGIIAVMAIIGSVAGCSNPSNPDTGGIAGKARFSGGANHNGILISLEETCGAVTQSVRAVSLRA